MGDGSMTTLTIADPEKDGIRKEHKSYSFESKVQGSLTRLLTLDALQFTENVVSLA